MIHDFLGAISQRCPCFINFKRERSFSKNFWLDPLGKWRCHFPRVRTIGIETELGGVEGVQFGTSEVGVACETSKQQCQISS